MFGWMSTEGLARRAARRPWRAVGAWLTIVVVAMVSASGLSNVLATGEEVTGSTEAAQAYRLVEERLRADTPESEFVVVEVDDPATLLAVVDEAVVALGALPEVAGVASHLDGNPGMVAPDGRTALVQVTLADYDDVAKAGKPVVEVIENLDARDGMRVTVVGAGSLAVEFQHLAKETLERGELIGLAIGLVILLGVFGAAVAAGLPVILALTSIVLAMGLTAIVGRVIELSTFVTNMITMIGLAVGIDYSLFIVQRFREERERGLEVVEAVAAAGATASRAVFFSGIAVVIALSGLLIMPNPIFRSLGLGAILVVIAAVGAALTLLPAILGVLGDRVNSLTLPRRRRRTERESTTWDRVTRAVTAHPVMSVVVTSAVLLGTSSFVAQIDLGTNGISALPEESNVRHAYEVLNTTFGGGATTTQVVIDAPSVDTPAVAAAVTVLRDRLGVDSFYGDITVEQAPSGDLVLVTAATRGDYASNEARTALRALRDEIVPATFAGIPARVLVGGDTAFMVDTVAETRAYMPAVFGFVLSFSFVLLMVVFRSIVVPVKAVLMNLLSVGAAYGAIVLVFQKGVGADLLGFQQLPVIESWLPLFLFSVLFGLSMDYHVFLLSRIKERYDQTGDNAEAVEHGLRSTGSIITGAAAIMVAVFGGFALGDLAMFQQMGFGLAVAVIVDATVIRSVLVPASMELLGDRNWYFPRWLEWLPRLDIEGVSQEAAPGQPGVTPALAEGGH